jgi:hypothetical protein
VFWCKSAAKTGIAVIEGVTTEKSDPTHPSFLSVFIPPINVTPFFGLAGPGGEDDEDCGVSAKTARQLSPD